MPFYSVCVQFFVKLLRAPLKLHTKFGPIYRKLRIYWLLFVCVIYDIFEFVMS